MQYLKKYKNKNGDDVIIAKMSDQHAINAYKFFNERKKIFDRDTDSFFYGFGALSGEMANADLDNLIDRRDKASRELQILVDSLKHEIDKRKLII